MTAEDGSRQYYRAIEPMVNHLCHPFILVFINTVPLVTLGVLIITVKAGSKCPVSVRVSVGNL